VNVKTFVPPIGNLLDFYLKYIATSVTGITAAPGERSGPAAALSRGRKAHAETMGRAVLGATLRSAFGPEELCVVQVLSSQAPPPWSASG
jgi:hypothetical protein